MAALVLNRPLWVAVYTLSDASAGVTHEREVTCKVCFFIYSVFPHAVLAFNF